MQNGWRRIISGMCQQVCKYNICAMRKQTTRVKGLFFLREMQPFGLTILLHHFVAMINAGVMDGCMCAEHFVKLQG